MSTFFKEILGVRKCAVCTISYRPNNNSITLNYEYPIENNEVTETTLRYKLAATKYTLQQFLYTNFTLSDVYERNNVLIHTSFMR